jgi:hypothetical protein
MMQLNSLFHPFLRRNLLGAAGAEALVKGRWPELCTLNIGWGRPAPHVLMNIDMATT